jgi:hypothetical protein
MQYVEAQKINVLTRRDEGPYTTYLADYKSFRTHHVDVTEYSALVFPELSHVLDVYLKCYRPKLLSSNDSHRFVFLNMSGSPFKPSQFSKYVTKVVEAR